jgi:uncharacterized surface protein with fasciclin (FAS1) repeats
MNMSKSSIAAFLFMALLAVACADGKQAEGEGEGEATKEMPAAEMTPPAETTPNIVGVAAGNENFTTLVAAVKAAGLVETLSAPGPFTVFAPVNTAFDKLPKGTVETLLKPESKEKLTGILTYHVVSGTFMAADVLAAIEKEGGEFNIPTVQGGSLVASLQDGKVILTDETGGMATIIMTDVAASNGVIHAIDAVVMP